MNLSAKEAAARLGVSVRTLDRYQDAGLIHPIRVIAGKGSPREFDPKEIDQLKDKK